MKKKTIICGVLASTIAVAATFGGCSLVSTNTAADMSQTVATVDISKADTLDKEFEAYKAAVGKTDIKKRACRILYKLRIFLRSKLRKNL